MHRPGQISEPIDKLEAMLADKNNGLSDGDRRFGGDLVRSFRRYGQLTPKQEPWVLTLIERAENQSTTGTMTPKAATHTTQQLGSVSAIFRLFDTAKKNHVQWPTIKIGVDGRKLLLTYSNPRDSIIINQINGSEKQWIAGLSRDGELTLSTRYPAPAGLTQTLLDFAADPSRASGIMGKKMRQCCFCGSGLTSKDSLYYGYGPICADKWGLEWGEARSHLMAEAIAELPTDMLTELGK